MVFTYLVYKKYCYVWLRLIQKWGFSIINKYKHQILMTIIITRAQDQIECNNLIATYKSNL